jgi:hypothetical protein
MTPADAGMTDDQSRHLSFKRSEVIGYFGSQAVSVFHGAAATHSV